jgi:glycosyltransferase involved in cell wall biosynthesis
MQRIASKLSNWRLVRVGPLKIAQVAPLHESVPPRWYGGTERVVSWLTEELVAEGHDVTLYASGDSETAATLRPICERALRLEQRDPSDALAWHILLCETVAQDADDYDIVHFHLDYLPFPFIRQSQIPALTTIHNRIDVPDLFPLFREFDDMCLVSISDAQREPMPWAGWLTTVHHGMPENLHQPCYEPEDHVVFLGRISPEKGVDRAVEIARGVGKKLRVAAKIEPADREYYESVRDLLEEPHVEFPGEIGEKDKTEFLGKAQALLVPIDWPEPFGLVMIEALACGTPVIAFRGGSVEEIIEDGVSGFIVDNVDQAIDALKRIGTIDRQECRLAFERRFTAERMCRDYVNAYKRIIGSAEPRAGCFRRVA